MRVSGKGQPCGGGRFMMAFQHVLAMLVAHVHRLKEACVRIKSRGGEACGACKAVQELPVDLIDALKGIDRSSHVGGPKQTAEFKLLDGVVPASTACFPGTAEWSAGSPHCCTQGCRL